MTPEEKQLLLQDISARLSYGVNIQVKEWTTLDTELKIGHIQRLQNDDIELKPFLRPMSSMTEEERHEIQEILGKDIEIFDDSINIIDSSRKRFSFLELQALLNWLNAHYFDYNHLIEKGLALEAPKDMYHIKTGIV